MSIPRWQAITKIRPADTVYCHSYFNQLTQMPPKAGCASSETLLKRSAPRAKRSLGIIFVNK
jgi:hypothetical protein